MRRSRIGLAASVVSIGLLASASAFAMGLDLAFPEPALGPKNAKGVVVWSHGRSITTEDSQAPTPVYLQALRDDGWDVLRFDRLSKGDTLTDSTNRLVEHTSVLKKKGYKQVILAGQSFGAFLSLMAADASAQVDGVIATAPAAYGSFDEFYDSWHLNATKLYPLLEQVKRARVMVFYFHGDNFDPGGRGERSREILSQRGLGFSVVDQPPYLTTHAAANSGLFLRFFGGCIRNFADNENLNGEMICNRTWGLIPSAELPRPPENVKRIRSDTAQVIPASAGSSSAEMGTAAGNVDNRKVWYGFYPNGREVLLDIVSQQSNGHIIAYYSVGPYINRVTEDDDAVLDRRDGRITDEGYFFQEPNKSTLRFIKRQDGGLTAMWMSKDGTESTTGSMRQIDPRVLDGGS